MKFTFGIVTTNKSQYLNKVVESIYNMNIPNDKYEIIIIGGDVINKTNNTRHFKFDESSKPGWITKKKNLITKHARYDNIVYMHDYLVFDNYWYEGFKEFGDNWDICMNKIQNLDKSRYRDWCVWSDPDLCYEGPITLEPKYGYGANHKIVLPPYTYKKTHFMYISGGYWVAKKHVMEKYPQDETLIWGEGEDLEWSERVLKSNEYKYKMNTQSLISNLKDKKLSAVYLNKE